MPAPSSQGEPHVVLPRPNPMHRNFGPRGARKNRYFFDLQGEHFMPDRYGMHFYSVEAAVDYAIACIRDFHALSQGKFDLTAWIEIISNEGKLTCVINYYDACGMSCPKGRSGLGAKIN